MYQWRKGIASWQCKDTLYISVPFTWLMPEAENRIMNTLRKTKTNWN